MARTTVGIDLASCIGLRLARRVARRVTTEIGGDMLARQAPRREGITWGGVVDDGCGRP
jgi:hypothetical protein